MSFSCRQHRLFSGAYRGHHQHESDGRSMVVHTVTASDVSCMQSARSKCWLKFRCRQHGLFSGAHRGYHCDQGSCGPVQNVGPTLQHVHETKVKWQDNETQEKRTEGTGGCSVCAQSLLIVALLLNWPAFKIGKLTQYSMSQNAKPQPAHAQMNVTQLNLREFLSHGELVQEYIAR